MGLRSLRTSSHGSRTRCGGRPVRQLMRELHTDLHIMNALGIPGTLRGPW